MPSAVPHDDALTPRSIRHAEFSTRQRGFSREEVNDFLAEVSEAWGEAISENKDLHRRLAEAQEAANKAALREQEARAELEKLTSEGRSGSRPAAGVSSQNMQATVILTRAQEMADALVSNAKEEARQLVEDASKVDSIDYVRTYAKITHEQMKTVVDQLARNLDLLGELANQDNRAATWESLQH
ncbi:DivIVA domain-containing protein [Ammonicoccus fulvus]|uniref:Cell wall synthesis protein Wag31 n=1 Tax=Ammonicoccus fulvus TaxID=3138240 RepID=A0ABZ3FL22_9ACTN